MRLRPIFVLLAALSAPVAFAQDAGSKPASPATLAAQQQVRASLPPDNGRDAEFAKRGFIATVKERDIRNADGKLVWRVGSLDWVKGDAPPEVNPSLWRHAKLLGSHGLYQIADGVWQVRGIDAANMEIVRGKTGWIVIDPLMTVETATVAMRLVNEQLGERPVSAVIYGHSHPDHFGGVRGVITPGTNPPIYAPEDLVEAAGSEYVLAGNAMSRRTSYQFGISLKDGPRGYVTSGIVERAAADGTVTLLPPTDYIKRTGETREIDGVTFEFQMVPETEAPSEMNFFLPGQKTLYVSEDTTCTLHNVQTPRGSLVRDANQWAAFITEQIGMWGDKAESLVMGHCWPRFGNDEIRNYLELQRDNYKFVHDQTVRMLNQGRTPTEIAEEIRLPKAITDQWSNRGYYGTVKHNAKGVFQRYIGWWDGIPAHLDQLPTAELSTRYVKAMGGAKGVLPEARRAMKAGEYRWAAQILNDLVFAEPDSREAKALLADTYEQLGYQQESAIWRNYYLVGAAELRGGERNFMKLQSPDIVGAMSTEAFLNVLSARLDPAKAGDRTMTVMLDGDGEKSLLTLRNSVLVAEAGKSIAAPTVAVGGTRAALMGLFIRKLPLDKLEAAGLKVAGDRAALSALIDAIETPQPDFAIVTP